MISIFDYGAGNLRSVENTLGAIGAQYELIRDAAAVERSHKLILPGVGHFGQMLRALDNMGVRDAIVNRIRVGVPFLGICIGMQLLFESSDESPGVAGLGVVPGRVTRLPAGVRLPQIGWNTIEVEPRSRLCAGLPDPAWCYFVHSYAAEPADPAVVTAWCEHGRRFPAVIEAGPVWATQFHPEKSGGYLGGGNAKHLKIELPANVTVTENVAGLLGGIALWQVRP